MPMPKTNLQATANEGKVYTSVVDQWLDTLPASDSDLFKEFAEITPSQIEIWVYAGVMGYKGSFSVTWPVGSS